VFAWAHPRHQDAVAIARRAFPGHPRTTSRARRASRPRVRREKQPPVRFARQKNPGWRPSIRRTSCRVRMDRAVGSARSRSKSIRKAFVKRCARAGRVKGTHQGVHRVWVCRVSAASILPPSVLAIGASPRSFRRRVRAYPRELRGSEVSRMCDGDGHGERGLRARRKTEPASRVTTVCAPRREGPRKLPFLSLDVGRDAAFWNAECTDCLRYVCEDSTFLNTRALQSALASQRKHRRLGSAVADQSAP